MKNSRYGVYVILVIQLPVAFLHGVHLLAMNTPTPAIRHFINQSYTERFGEIPKESTVSLIMTLVQSALVWGSLIGSFLVQPALQLLSGRKSILLVHVVNVISIIFMGPTAKYASSYESLIVGRVLAGISRGIAFSVVMVIVAELSSRSDMAISQAPFHLFIPISAAFAAGIGHHQALGNPDLWIWIVCCPAVGSIIYFGSYAWIPESPVSLLKKGKREAALDVLKTLRKGNVDNETELNTWENEIKETSKAKAIPLREIIRDDRLRLQFFTVLMISSVPQLGGIQGLVMYSNEIFLRAGVDRQYVTFASTAMNLVPLASFAVFVSMEKRTGSKKVFIVGCAVTCGSLLVFTIANGLSSDIGWLSYLALAALLCYIFGQSLGPFMCRNSLSAELTTIASRPVAAFYSGCSFWIMGAITVFVFPYSIDALNTYAYVPFVIFMSVLIPFFIFYIPDTYKRNNAQIQNSFRKKSMQSISEIVGLSRKKSSRDIQEMQNYENKSYVENT